MLKGEWFPHEVSMAVLKGTKEGLQVKVNLRCRVMVQGATTPPSSANFTSRDTLKALGFMFMKEGALLYLHSSSLQQEHKFLQRQDMSYIS